MAQISELTLEEVKDYLRVDYDYDDDDALILTIMIGAKVFIKGYTGLSQESIELKEDLAIVYLVLCNEMYSQRQYTVERDKVNVVVKTILDMYAVNLL